MYYRMPKNFGKTGEKMREREGENSALLKKSLLKKCAYIYSVCSIFLSGVFLHHTAYGFPFNEHSKLSHISSINPIINTLTHAHMRTVKVKPHFNISSKRKQ